MEKILIVEDDTDINNMMADALQKAGYGCVQAFSGTEGLLYIERESFSLVVLDLMLPGMNGETLLPQIKERQAVPVIVVSARDSIDSKVGLLTSGAEDYMTKPFNIEEFIARVGVQIRRFSGKPQNRTEGVVSYKEMKLNPESYSVTVNNRPLDFTKQEFKILELLLMHPNKVFSKQDIYDYAWDDIYIGEDKTINVHISNIRKKLKTVTEEEYIETVWGIGFRLKK